MLGKDASKQTDWNDSFREDSPYEPRLSHATTYCYKTRCNETLFKLGVTDVSSDSNDDENLLGKLVSDSIDTRYIRQFIDYTKFSNPFIKYKSQRDITKNKPTKDNPPEKLQLKADAKVSQKINGTTGNCMKEKIKPQFVSQTKLQGDKPIDVPNDFSLVQQQISPVIEKEPEPPKDMRTIILKGTYYMHEMSMAVNNDTALTEAIGRLYKTHIIQIHQNLHELLEARSKEQPLALPKKPELPATLDIDETLVHVVRSNEKMSHQHSLKLQRTGYPTVEIKFNLRPGAREFLKEMKESCNVALMTASHKSYADQIYNFLDPKKEILCGVFSKDHCINYTKGRSVKDLSSFDYPLERIVLVDNFISAFAMQIDNGIPILPYYEGTEDKELSKLSFFIKKTILNEKDVRSFLNCTFWISIYHEITDVRELVARLQEGFRISD